MIEAWVDEQDLVVAVTGLDAWLLARRRRWSVSVPLRTIEQAKTGPTFGPFRCRHVNDRGGEHWSRPGRLICAGLWAPTLRIDLASGPYRKMLLSVADPDDVASGLDWLAAAQPRS